MEEMAIITKKELFYLINTLKSIDVCGFDSMDKVVGSVAFLEDVLKREPEVKSE